MQADSWHLILVTKGLVCKTKWWNSTSSSSHSTGNLKKCQVCRQWQHDVTGPPMKQLDAFVTYFRLKVQCSPRSHDLTTVNCHLYRQMKEAVYCTKLATLEE